MNRGIRRITMTTDVVYSPDDGGHYASCLACDWTGDVLDNQAARTQAITHRCLKSSSRNATFEHPTLKGRP